ncbi:MAG: inositol monophosphatase [Rhizobiaceae bacterium]|nr:inositol monophosphatase [Rhizobiaceae bacterium]
MRDSEIDLRFEFARSLAKSAGELARTYFRDPVLGQRYKALADLVTDADLAVDGHISRAIAQSFPTDAILSEEAGGDDADTLWIVDPIDGTQNFARGIARFAISIALCLKGRPIFGVVYDPIAAELFYSRTGGGAFLNGKRISTSQTLKVEEALVEAGYSAKFGWRTYHAMTGFLLEEGFGVRQSGSAVLGLCEVACGRIDGYCELHLESWDVAAAAVILEEAGGRIIDFLAPDWVKHGGPIVAATEGIWDRLRYAASRVPAFDPVRTRSFRS